MLRPITSYFATTGRGLEDCLAEEIKEKLCVQQVKCIDGKVFFSSDADVSLLKSLKTAERLMVHVYFNTNIKFPYAKGKCRRLIRKMTEDITTWEKSLEAWKEFQQEKKDNLETETVSVLPGNSAKFVQEKKDISETERVSVMPDNSAKSLHSENTECQDTVNTEQYKNVPDQERCWNISDQEENKDHHVAKKMKVESSKRETHVDDGDRSNENDSSSHGNHNAHKADKTHCGSQINFRISCKCTGKMKYTHSPQEFAINMGTALAKKYGWNIELRKPKLDISVHVSDDYMLIGLPVTFEPLSKRHYIKKIGIRSTIAWTMCNMAGIESGHVVLDPMCGTGTVLLEAAMSWKDILCVGSDNNINQLKLAQLNIQHAKKDGVVQTVHADVKCLPLKDNSVDSIVSDIPFGLNHSTLEDVKILYPIMQREMHRVLKPGGKAVLLTSGTLVDYLIQQMTGHKSNIRSFSVTAQSSDSVKTTQSQMTQESDLDKMQQNDVSNKAPGGDICDEVQGNDSRDKVHGDDVTDKVQQDDISNRTQQEDIHGKTNWSKLRVHYLKIALVHAYICIFIKTEGGSNMQ